VKLKSNMTRKGIAPAIQEQVVTALGSFALYGFPESHALSFALLAYASCWLKVHRPQEFYCGLLNNQPMGFYSPATLVKEARRRGIRFRPVCVVRSNALCHIEADASIRMGLIYAKGLHRDRAEQIVVERNRQPFASLADLLMRVPLNKLERRVLAKIGALNLLTEHRRTALWHVESVFDPNDIFAGGDDIGATPLVAMDGLERLQNDYDGSGLTLGPHPMRYLRAQLPHVTLAIDLANCPHGEKLSVAGVAICRQRPGTAKGTVFVSLEDETGICNAIVRSELFEKLRLTITHEPFLLIEGVLQKIDGVINVLAQDVKALGAPAAIDMQSYDFH
jgi:error-prone DNA polymerase